MINPLTGDPITEAQMAVARAKFAGAADTWTAGPLYGPLSAERAWVRVSGSPNRQRGAQGVVGVDHG